MIRLRVKEYVEENAPELNRYELSRRANLSHTFMNKVWNEPEKAHLYLDNLDTVAQALSDYLHKEVTVCDLLQATNTPRSSSLF